MRQYHLLTPITAIALSACAGGSAAPSYPALVAGIQAGYAGVVSALLLATSKGLVPAPYAQEVAAAETLLTPEVAALVNTTSPTTVPVILQDLQTLVSASPAGPVQTNVAAAVALVAAAWAAYQAATPVPVVTPVPVATPVPVVAAPVPVVATPVPVVATPVPVVAAPVATPVPVVATPAPVVTPPVAPAIVIPSISGAPSLLAPLLAP